MRGIYPRPRGRLELWRKRESWRIGLTYLFALMNRGGHTGLPLNLIFFRAALDYFAAPAFS